MLDLISVFTKGGVVLWEYNDPMPKLLGAPVNTLIQDIIEVGCRLIPRLQCGF